MARLITAPEMLDNRNLLTLLALLSLPLIFLGFSSFQVLGGKKKKKKKKKSNVFPFLKLPPELREQVYEYLVEDGPCYPRRPADSADGSVPTMLAVLFSFIKSLLQRVLPLALWKALYLRSRGSTPSTASAPLLRVLDAVFGRLLVGLRRSLRKPSTTSGSSAIFACRQLHDELLALLCRRAPLTLYIDESNHDAAARPRLWDLSPRIAAGTRRCEVNVLATPGMLPSFDPRVAPADWPLRDRAHAELLQLTRTAASSAVGGQLRISLRVHARGSQIWNPIWLWHYTSQAFKRCELKGFDDITFHLQGWSPGENKLARGADDGEWQWQCPDGHFVRRDTDGPMPIREFCQAICQDCSGCPPRV